MRKIPSANSRYRQIKLSDAKCRTARAKARPYKLSDGGGLYLFVAKNGSRLWRLDYRSGGKRQTMAFGAYPDLSLAEAREAREKARKLICDGLNPMQERRVERITREFVTANTFGVVVDELLEKLVREQRPLGRAREADAVVGRLFRWVVGAREWPRLTR